MIGVDPVVYEQIERQYNSRPEGSAPDPVLLNTIIMDAVRDVLPEKPRQVKHADWFDASNTTILDMIKHRRALQQARFSSGAAMQCYKQYKVKVRQLLRVMQSKYYDDKSKALQTAADKNDSRAQFAAMKEFHGTPKQATTKVLRKTDGTLTGTDQELAECWYQHFKALLNQTGITDFDMTSFLHLEQQTILEQLNLDFTILELYTALNALSNEKAAGPDGKAIEVENFAESDLYVPALLESMNEMLRTGIVPNILKDVNIAILYKKGPKEDPGNYRGLSLIAHLGKVLERLIQNRLIVCAEQYHWLPEEQNGFRANRSTVDSIWISRTITSYA